MRKPIALGLTAAVLLGVGVSYWAYAKQAAASDPERLADDFTICVIEPKDYTRTGLPPARTPTITVQRRWAELHLDKRGWGSSGTTGARVDVHHPDWPKPELFGRMMDAVNASPERARGIFGHRDLRVRLLAYAAMRASLRGQSGRIPLPAPHAVDAMDVLVAGTDASLAAGTLHMLARAGTFRAELLRRGLAHPATAVRHAASYYADRCLKRLDPSSLREVLALLIQRLDDRDGVVRGTCFNAIGHAVFELDCRLQGVRKERQHTIPQAVKKLPPLPTRYEDLALANWALAAEVKAKWQQWCEKLPDYDEQP